MINALPLMLLLQGASRISRIEILWRKPLDQNVTSSVQKIPFISPYIHTSSCHHHLACEIKALYNQEQNTPTHKMSRMKLEEVTDEYDLQQEDDQYSDISGSDTDSETDDSDGSPLDETLWERVSALRDIIPAPTRAKISSAFSTTKYGVENVALFGGKTLWAITSSLLLLGIPFMMAVELEGQEQEKMSQLQAGVDSLAPGAQSQYLAGGQQQQQPEGVRPPGV